MLSLVCVRSKEKFNVGEIRCSFGLRKVLYYVQEIVMSPQEYYYILEFPYGDLSHHDIYDNFIKPIFTGIDAEDFIQVKQFALNNRFNSKEDSFNNLFVINQKIDVIDQLSSIIDCLFVGGFAIEEGELYHKVSSVRPDDNFRLNYFLKNFTNIQHKKKLYSLPAVDFSNLVQVENFQNQLEDIILKVFTKEEAPTVVKSVIVDDETLRVMFKNQKDTKKIIDRLNHGKWGPKEISVKMSFNVEELIPEPVPEPEPEPEPEPDSESESDSNSDPKPKSTHQIKPQPIPKPDTEQKEPYKQFVVSNFDYVMSPKNLKKVFKDKIMNTVIPLDPASKLRAQEFIISVESPTKETELKEFLKTYVHLYAFIPFIFPYSEDTLESDRKEKISELLNHNTVEYIFTNTTQDLVRIETIIQSLSNQLHVIVRCAVYDEENERKVYVSFNTEAMQKKALKGNYKIAKKAVKKSKYISNTKKVSNNQDIKFQQSKTSYSSSKGQKIKIDHLDDDILFITKKKKIPNIITFKSTLKIDEMEKEIRDSMINGSGSSPDKKQKYKYALDVDKFGGINKFKTEFPKYGINSSFLGQNKMIINCPPGISIENISSLFDVPTNNVVPLFDKYFIGYTSFLIRFTNLEQSRKFDLFITEKERSLNSHFVFAYNACEVTNWADRRRVIDFIINRQDSFTVVIKNMPRSNYQELHDLCLFSELNPKDFQEKIKIRLIFQRETRNKNRFYFIVVYNTKEAKDFAIENIKEFKGETISCEEYKKSVIEADTVTVMTHGTEKSELSSANSFIQRQFIWE